MTYDPRTGWFDWAIPFQLPPGKLLTSQHSSMELLTAHSLEGVVNINAEMRALAGKGWDRMNATEQAAIVDALHRCYWAFQDAGRGITAWHATVPRAVPAGTALIQHAPLFVQLAHGHSANSRGPGIESEDGAGRNDPDLPLDAGQERTWNRIITDLHAATGIWYLRDNGRIKMHREMANNQTACPSNLYDQWFARLPSLFPPKDEGGEMTSEDRDMIAKLNAAIQRETKRNDEQQAQIDLLKLRGRLHRLADDPDVMRVEKAVELLKAGGIDLR